MITHGYATRARLEAANGDADNQVLLLEDGRYGGFSLNSPTLRYALASMDAWLTALTRDGSSRPSHRQVVRAKPTDLTDACWSRDATPRKIIQRLTPDNAGECGRLYPAYPTPRLIAGAPPADDVVTCRHKPIDPERLPRHLPPRRAPPTGGDLPRRRLRLDPTRRRAAAAAGHLAHLRLT